MGEHLTQFLRQLRADLASLSRELAVGVPRGDVLGHPLGNATLDWCGWVSQGLVDELIVDQDSSRCPSMWHDLWPMHRGGGYRHSYLDAAGLPDLESHLRDGYVPALDSTASRLLVARQWAPRDRKLERLLLENAAVDGLVFSSFRHDNRGPIARGDWRAS